MEVFRFRNASFPIHNHSTFVSKKPKAYTLKKLKPRVESPGVLKKIKVVKL